MIHSNALLTNEEIMAKEWLCNKCLISNSTEIFQFGLENNIELQNIMQADSLRILENLPSYEITSKVSDIESLRLSTETSDEERCKIWRRFFLVC